MQVSELATPCSRLLIVKKPVCSQPFHKNVHFILPCATLTKSPPSHLLSLRFYYLYTIYIQLHHLDNVRPSTPNYTEKLPTKLCFPFSNIKSIATNYKIYSKCEYSCPFPTLFIFMQGRTTATSAPILLNLRWLHVKFSQYHPALLEL